MDSGLLIKTVETIFDVKELFRIDKLSLQSPCLPNGLNRSHITIFGREINISSHENIETSHGLHLNRKNRALAKNYIKKSQSFKIVSGM